MATSPLPRVDWSQPWLAPYRPHGQAVERDLVRGLAVAAALNHRLDGSPILLGAGPLRFAEPDAALPGEAYEAFIARTARVPTRDNLHDLFNGLVWLVFPSLKRLLNDLQARQIACAGVGAHRGTVRDRLTLIDENGALWRAPSVLVAALRRRDWQGLFVTHRELWQQAQVTVVGHALLEKLTLPRKAMTAHAWPAPVGFDGQRAVPIDLLDGGHLPLPLLGIPGWWPDNEREGFYDDAAVFRPARG